MAKKKNKRIVSLENNKEFKKFAESEDFNYQFLKILIEERDEMIMFDSFCNPCPVPVFGDNIRAGLYVPEINFKLLSDGAISFYRKNKFPN